MIDHKPPALLTQYCTIARPIMRAWGLSSNSCIGATRITCYCLEVLGFKAVPLATKFAIDSPQLKLAYTSGLSDEELAQADAALSAFGKGWRGHLVTYVDDRWLLDSTFDQADDAFEAGGKGRVFGLKPECMLFPLPDALPAQGFLATYNGISDDGVELRVRYATTKDETWRTSDAWNDEGLPFIAELILTKLRDE